MKLASSQPCLTKNCVGSFLRYGTLLVVPEFDGYVVAPFVHTVIEHNYLNVCFKAFAAKQAQILKTIAIVKMLFEAKPC